MYTAIVFYLESSNCSAAQRRQPLLGLSGPAESTVLTFLIPLPFSFLILFPFPFSLPPPPLLDPNTNANSNTKGIFYGFIFSRGWWLWT